MGGAKNLIWDRKIVWDEKCVLTSTTVNGIALRPKTREMFLVLTSG